MSQNLQCPRCNGSVSIPESAAGKRVRCPHCEQSFLAPGIEPVKNDDDDWLILDSDPVGTEKLPNQPPQRTAGTNRSGALPGPVPVGSSPDPNSPPTKKSTPSISAEDDDLLKAFSADLEEFTSQTERPPAPTGSARTSNPTPPQQEIPDQDLFGDLPPMESNAPPSSHNSFPPASGRPAPVSTDPPAEAAIQDEYETEFKVRCVICGSLLFATAEQSGQTIKCSDCHSAIKVPPPPKVRRKQNMDIENAETFQLENTKVKERSDPFQKSAQQLLEEASRVEEKSDKPVDTDIPSIKEWFSNVFGIFLDPGVLAHWLGLSIFAGVPTAVALHLDTPILLMGLFPAGFFLGILVVCCGFAILQSVANGEDRVTEWPVFDPFAWFDQLIVALAAAVLAAVPAWTVTFFLIGPDLLSVAITMFSVYTVFPFLLLSMLDMQSIFMPFSAEVARSITKCEESWGGFYFSSGLLFALLFLLFLFTSNMAVPIGAVVSIVAAIAITFTYFSMIGRLAYAIGQAVNAPPMENDIDRSKRSQPRDGTMN